MVEYDISKHGKKMQELMEKSPCIFFLEEYDAGASPSTFKEDIHRIT
jgi:hypothetical protein